MDIGQFWLVIAAAAVFAGWLLIRSWMAGRETDQAEANAHQEDRGSES